MPIDLDKELARLQDRKAATKKKKKDKEPGLPLVQKPKPGARMSVADLQRELGLTSQRIVRQQVKEVPAQGKRQAEIDLWAQLEKLPSQVSVAKPPKPSRTRPKPPPSQQQEEAGAQEEFDVEAELQIQMQEEEDEQETVKLVGKPIPAGKLTEWQKKRWKYTAGGMPADYPLQKEHPVSLGGFISLSFDIATTRDVQGKVTFAKVAGFRHPDVPHLAVAPASPKRLSGAEMGEGLVWTVTHLPSGYAVGTRVRDPRSALIALDKAMDWSGDIEAIQKATRALWQKRGGKGKPQQGYDIRMLDEIVRAADPYFVAVAQYQAKIKAQEQRKRTKYQTYVRELDSDGMIVLLAPLVKQADAANQGRGEWPNVIDWQGLTFDLKDLPVWQKQHFGSAVQQIEIRWQENVHVGSSSPPPLALSWPGGKPTATFPHFRYKGATERIPIRQKPLVLTGEAASLADRIKAAALVHFQKEAASWKIPLVPHWYEEDRSVIDALTTDSWLTCRSVYSDKQSKSPHAWFACTVEHDGKLWICDHNAGGHDFIWSDRPLVQSMKNYYIPEHEWTADPSQGYAMGKVNTSAVPVLFLQEVVPKAQWKLGTFGHRERQGSRPGNTHVGEGIEVHGVPFVRTGRTRVVHRVLSLGDLGGDVPGWIYRSKGKRLVIVGFRKKPETGKKKRGSHDHRTYDPRGLYAGEVASDGSIRNVRWFEGDDLASFRPIFRETVTRQQGGFERVRAAHIDPGVLAAARQKIPDLDKEDG